ncbi:MAG: T9SS type A sorting domain-containing protein [Sphingobacteriales bacterium]|nr:T9SS type A sorting domain-containing protein [Sphingobacteriales bacterium]
MSNPENSALDGVAIAYNIADQNGNLISGTPPAPQNVGAGQSNIVSIAQTTANLEGNYILSLTLNPNQQLPEKYSFNNLLHLPFTVVRDGVNPYIDVTFDGRHITEGELVSANPEIFIRIKDDNPYLPLSDTADFYLALRYTDPETGLPQLTETPIPFNSPLLQFVAPTSNAAEQGNNTADIRLNLQLSTAGRYELIVRAKDRSGNAFAKRAYTMQFSIDPRPMISKLVNYPNPFTTRTHFVFTLTGSEIPQQISIEIRNISGRVVRNIDQSELGDLHIGNNITSFAWDGTDQYGNALANGLYLYRVVTRLDGQALEHYQTAADNFFNEHGWGKMYLLR